MTEPAAILYVTQFLCGLGVLWFCVWLWERRWW